MVVFFFFKQKSAYEVRISDWSSDVCSSDLERLVIVSAAGEQLCSITLDIRVEAMAWSPNGRGLLVLGADSGADVSGAEGGFALRTGESGPNWLPNVASSKGQDRWRRLYRWFDGASTLAPVAHPPVKLWEAAWPGELGEAHV